MQRRVRGGKVYRDINLGKDHASEGCKLGSKVLFDGFHFSSMEEYMFLLMVEILALSYLTSFWVSVKLECNVLK